MRKRSAVATRWATLSEAAALVLTGWRILSYGTGPGERSVLLTLGA
jgi:hypothetical protein